MWFVCVCVSVHVHTLNTWVVAVAYCTGSSSTFSSLINLVHGFSFVSVLLRRFSLLPDDVIDDKQNNFSLASLEVGLENTTTTSILLNQQLISMDSLSPNAQDQRINNNNPNVIK